MKNPYSKLAKYLDKQSNIYFQHTGSAVYMTDGVIALKAPADEYHQFITPLSDLFPRVLCVGSWIERSSRSGRTGVNLERLLESFSSEKALECSPFLVELPQQGRRKAKKARLFFSDDIIAVDEALLDLFNDFPVPLDWHSSGRRVDPLIHNDGAHIAVVLPLSVDDSVYAPWKR